ncbi:MAG TPA: NAD-dependent epimerase/dehydratase family protein [Propionibacteriaceae bacterium]|nr:NAD-dependent epimerase/dehydratase family protein [Propionibacteriaceae bacterium]
MTDRSVLFVGGTGVISAASTRRAVEAGWQVTVLNRGKSSTRPIPDEADVVVGDISDVAGVSEALGDRHFDVVADFLTFTPDQLSERMELFGDRTGQYVFISSASAYQTPPARMPVVESTPLRNPHWQYSRDKIACEDLLVQAYRDRAFPATIVRPSHTYDKTMLPFDGGWTVAARMLRGDEVVVHGDGTSLWTLTHTSDFAQAFVGLLGHPAAIGETFHITSDEALSWNQIFSAVAAALRVEPRLVHVPSAAIAVEDPEWGAGLLGDKAHTMIFDNAKVKALVPEYTAVVPYVRGAAETVAWYTEDPSRQRVDAEMDATISRLVDRFRVG